MNFSIAWCSAKGCCTVSGTIQRQPCRQCGDATDGKNIANIYITCCNCIGVRNILGRIFYRDAGEDRRIIVHCGEVDRRRIRSVSQLAIADFYTIGRSEIAVVMDKLHSTNGDLCLSELRDRRTRISHQLEPAVCYITYRKGKNPGGGVFIACAEVGIVQNNGCAFCDGQAVIINGRRIIYCSYLNLKTKSIST